MPNQNRVTPFGRLIATPSRGTLMGNRGCLHDNSQRIRRQFRGHRWIICVLEFRGRRRSVMMPGRYTELFFLDEATALAAGHRPCAECQRSRFNQFREIWATANPDLTTAARPAATALDALLHAERALSGNQPLRLCRWDSDIPDGTFVADSDHNAYLALRRQLLKWTPDGYEPARIRTMAAHAIVLTPASIVQTLSAGYPVDIHWSALQAIEQAIPRERIAN